MVLRMTGAVRRIGQTLACGLLAILVCAACSSSSPKSGTPKSDPKATLLVWTDATRLPGFKLFQSTHPDVKMNIQTIELGTALTKLSLLQRSHQPLPDVIFTSPNDIATLTAKNNDYAQDLSKLVPAKTIETFGPTLNGCKVNGKVYCLQNDLAQTVLWYNKKLMEKFGYSVPTTWEQYKEVGLKVAAEHPGYLVGAFGNLALVSYFWPSGCPVNQITSTDTVKINLNVPECTRVADLIDPLIAAGSVAKVESVDPEFIKAGMADKILMLPAGSFFGDLIFKPTYKTPPGELAAALSPTWAGETTHWSGSMGGAIFVVSRSSRNVQGAAAVATWMATDINYQKSQPTFPAYPPAATAWSQRVAADSFYAQDPFPVLQQAASLIRPTFSAARFDTAPPFGTTVVAAAKAGKPLEGSFNKFQTALEQLAKINNYRVTQ